MTQRFAWPRESMDSLGSLAFGISSVLSCSILFHIVRAIS